MSGTLPARRCSLHHLAIPLKRKVAHAASERMSSEPLVFQLELANHTIGYGETLPREYVTGESIAQVRATIENIFLPMLIDFRPSSFGEVIEFAAELPCVDECQQPITAARAAVELAVLDAYSRAFGTDLAALAGYFEELWLEPPGSTHTARFACVVPAVGPAETKRMVRFFRLMGFRHFKLKVGDEGEAKRVQAIMVCLRRLLAKERGTLTLDANSAWRVDEALNHARNWADLPLTALEQPLAAKDLVSLASLAHDCPIPLMVDESLITEADAAALIDAKAAQWFNIRLSKNGGLIPSIRLAIQARRAGVQTQLGCMVGETSLLSAAARRFLQIVPGITRCEGNYGGWLLKGDVVSKPLRFGMRGRWRALEGYGLGIDVDPVLINRWALTEPQRFEF